MNLSRPFILRPVATTLLMIAPLLCGAIAYKHLRPIGRSHGDKPEPDRRTGERHGRQGLATMKHARGRPAEAPGDESPGMQERGQFDAEEQRDQEPVDEGADGAAHILDVEDEASAHRLDKPA